jgi:hypothetical protein
MAQVEGSTLETSGTCTISRPVCMGSTLLITVPRYFPKKFPKLDPFPASSLLHAENALTCDADLQSGTYLAEARGYTKR